MRGPMAGIPWSVVVSENKRRPARALLTLASIVIAVAATIAVSLGTDAARSSYNGLIELSGGPAALEVASRDGERFSPAAADAFRGVAGLKAVTPLLFRPTILRFTGQRVQLMAVGLVADDWRKSGGVELREGRLFEKSDEVALEAAFADSVKAKVGDRLLLLTLRGVRFFHVAGIVTTRSALSVADGGVMFMPIEQVQGLFRLQDRCDSLRVTLDGARDRDATRRDIARLLPAELEVRERVSRARLSDEVLMAGQQGLNFVVALGLAMSVFMILNTFLMNVTERRRQLSVLRAIGATPSQVRALLLKEGLALGVVGTLLGVPVGVAGAWLMARAMGSLMGAELPSAELDWQALALAGLIGPCVSLAACWWPARRAGSIPPLQAAAIAGPETAEKVPVSLLLVSFAALVAGGAAIAAVATSRLPGWVAIVAGLVMLGSFVLLTTVVLSPITRLAAVASRWWWPVEADLAKTHVLRHPWRTLLTVGILVVAISNAIGMGSAVMDTIDDIRAWHRRALAGDFFLARSNDHSSAKVEVVGEEPLEARVAKLPNVARVEPVRFVTGRAGELPALVVAREIANAEELFFELDQGDESSVRRLAAEGEVVIGSVLARRAGTKVGDMIEVEALGVTRDVKVAGIGDEYIAGGLTILMDRAAAKSLFGVAGVDVLVVTAAAGQRDAVEATLRDFAGREKLRLQSLADLMGELDQLMAGVVGAFWALLAICFCVAAFGIGNTLAMNVQEQVQEIGLLRMIGMTRAQVGWVVILQAAYLGWLGMLMGVASGLTTAFNINWCIAPILGHQVDFNARWGLVACVLAATLLVVLVGTWLPLRRASRLDLLEAIACE